MKDKNINLINNPINKYRKWIIILLIVSSFIQLNIIKYNFETENIQKNVSSLEKDEYYGIVNNSLRYIVEDRTFAYQSYLNVIELLKKIAKDRLSKEDINMLKNNIELVRNKKDVQILNMMIFRI